MIINFNCLCKLLSFPHSSVSTTLNVSSVTESNCRNGTKHPSFSLFLSAAQSVFDRILNVILAWSDVFSYISSSDFLKREQMLLLSLPLSFRHLLLLQAAFAAVVLLRLPVLGPCHGQSFSSALLLRASSLHGLLVGRKPASLLALSQAARRLFLLAVSLLELLSDQQALHQQSPV